MTKRGLYGMTGKSGISASLSSSTAESILLLTRPSLALPFVRFFFFSSFFRLLIGVNSAGAETSVAACWLWPSLVAEELATVSELAKAKPKSIRAGTITFILLGCRLVWSMYGVASKCSVVNKEIETRPLCCSRLNDQRLLTSPMNQWKIPCE